VVSTLIQPQICPIINGVHLYIIGEARKGETLSVIETRDNWHKVRDFNSKNNKTELGWIRKDLVVQSGSETDIAKPKPPKPAEPAKPLAPPARHAEAYYNRGVAYFKKGLYNKAISYLDKAIQINPRDALAYYNRGFIYLRKGVYNEAISDFRKACDMGDKKGCERVNQF
jgi:tetratricopeptide (TPR) repeat protein